MDFAILGSLWLKSKIVSRSGIFKVELKWKWYWCWFRVHAFEI